MNAPPAELGYRMPAEWEPHQSTWISWPHNAETWPDELEKVEAVMADVVRVLSLSEAVRINVGSDVQHERALRAIERAGAVGDIRFHFIPTDDAWVRDYGPLFVVGGNGELAATVWRFNSWGGKYPPYDLDDAAGGKMAAELGVPVFASDMILEGGSIDVNGRGLAVTTKSCLLNENRNPHLSRREIEDRLRRYLGVASFIWLDDGIAGDDTDGHIDDVARFVSDRTMLVAVPSDPSHEDYDVLNAAAERLREASTPEGDALRIIELPMPEPVVVKGERMPASYANFYIGNRTVLVPSFDDPNDDVAVSIVGQCFPTRHVAGIDCSDLIWGLGALHCLTQQVPRGK